MKNISTEKKINDNLFKIKVGTINKKNPSTFYINLITNVSHDNNFSDKLLTNITKRYKQIAKKIILDNDFDTNFILDVDMSEESLKKKGRAYLTAQFFMKQRKYNNFNDIYDKINNSILQRKDELSSALTENGFLF